MKTSVKFPIYTVPPNNIKTLTSLGILQVHISVQLPSFQLILLLFSSSSKHISRIGAMWDPGQVFECIGVTKLLTKMFKNAKHNSILVNSFKKHASWPSNEKVCNSVNYTEYTLNQIVTALQFILDTCYVQFAGRIYKQIVGIPMGGNACPFIADLYLSWCEYEYMAKIMKEDVALAKSLNYNSRYMDDIITINFFGFGQLANKIYDPSLILKLSSVSGRSDAFLDLYIRIHNNRFYHGIYHKVDDFSFEVISFPFLTSNISKFEGPKCFYSQIIRFARLCNNLQDFQTRLKLTFLKLVKRGCYEF